MTAEVQEEIIRIALRSYERLPLFEVVMERVVQALGPALRAALNVQAERDAAGRRLHGVRRCACLGPRIRG